jgi:hypothetical protein
MSQKNETAVLVLSLLFTIGLAGAGIWWLTSRGGITPGGLSPENQTFSKPPTGNSPESEQAIQQRLSTSSSTSDRIWQLQRSYFRLRSFLKN